MSHSNVIVPFLAQINIVSVFFAVPVPVDPLFFVVPVLVDLSCACPRRFTIELISIFAVPVPVDS